MPRIKRLRVALSWTQVRMADYLGVDQSTVSAMERGQRESGPVSRLLDLLEPSAPPSAVCVAAADTRASEADGSSPVTASDAQFSGFATAEAE